MDDWDIYLKFAYASIFVAILFSYTFHRRQIRRLRQASDRFSAAFLEISNYVSPTAPTMELSIRHTENGLTALPLEQQPEAIQEIMRRSDSEPMGKAFQELTEAMDEVRIRSGSGKTARRQFEQPLREIFVMTHNFLLICENPQTARTPEQIQAFSAFLWEQTQHRRALRRRISSSFAPAFDAMNTAYPLF